MSVDIEATNVGQLSRMLKIKESKGTVAVSTRKERKMQKANVICE
jgi:hypothetical protein